jgi:hypothetical protein
MHDVSNIKLPVLWHNCISRAKAGSLLGFRDHTQTRVHTFGRTSLDEGSARRRDLYLTTHNTHKRQASMLPAGLEPTISIGDRQQTLALDRAATETGILFDYLVHI